MTELSKEQRCVKLLTIKQAELGRLPEKADFTETEVMEIKSALGPWPRALEKAGLKEVSPGYIAKKQKVKAKRNAARKNKKLKKDRTEQPP